MADIADLADEQTAIYLADALRNAERVAKTPLMNQDEWACANCDADLPSRTMRFCDAECRADFDRRLSVRRKQGLV